MEFGAGRTLIFQAKPIPRQQEKKLLRIAPNFLTQPLRLNYPMHTAFQISGI